MAKTTITAATKAQGATVTDSKKFNLKLKVYLKPYEFDGKSGMSVIAELIEPFAEYAEDFNNVRIAPRWDKDASLFKFRMGIYLKTHDDIVLNGYCESVGYESKRPEDNGKIIYYPGLFFSVPYSGEVIEFGFKKRVETDAKGNKTYSESSDCYVFRDLVSEKWGGSYEPGASSATDETTEGNPHE